MSPRAGRDSLSPRERAGVREPVSTLAMVGMGKVMESALFGTDLLTDLEPGGLPGGETPPSTAGGTPAATDVPQSPAFSTGVEFVLVILYRRRDNLRATR